MRRALALFAALLIAGACYSGSVVIRNRPPDRPIEYTWSLQALSVFSDRSIERTSRQQHDARVTLTNARRDGKMVVRLRVDPESASVDGRPIEERPPFTLELPLGNDPAAPVVVQADGLVATGANGGITSFFTDFRPPLPSGPVEIGDTWPADVVREEGRSSLELKGRARLAQLAVKDRRRLARIVSVRQGPVTSTQQVGKLELTLSGRSNIKTDTFLDLDDGTMITSVERSRSEYVVADPGGDPEASISVRLVSRLKLVSR